VLEAELRALSDEREQVVAQRKLGTLSFFTNKAERLVAQDEG
jgi:hypothetical protein